jgi:hypothetical protein
MLVLKTLAYGAAALLTLTAPFYICGKFNAACRKEFGMELLSLPAFVGAGIAAIVLGIGVIYYYESIAKHKELSDPLALLGLGAGGLILTLYICIRLTNVFHGIAATLLLTAFGVIVAPIMILGIFCVAFEGERRVVVRKRFWD